MGIDRVNWILGLLMMVLFWGGFVVLVVLALRGRDASQRRDGGGANSPDARSILDERFARGEVSEDEFEQKRRVLEHATPLNTIKDRCRRLPGRDRDLVAKPALPWRIFTARSPVADVADTVVARAMKGGTRCDRGRSPPGTRPPHESG